MWGPQGLREVMDETGRGASRDQQELAARREGQAARVLPSSLSLNPPPQPPTLRPVPGDGLTER